MWNDIETDRDYLNFSATAKTVSEIIISANGSPISIGVSGGWGTGKSSMVKMIGAELNKENTTKKKKGKNRYIVIDFNAWRYQGYDDAKSALMRVVSDTLIKLAEEDDSLLTKAKDFAARIDWIQLAQSVGPAAVGMISGETQLTPLYAAQLFTLNPENLLKNKPEKSIPGQVDELRLELEELLASLDKILIILVDDLDRCLPPTTISTLEAMRMMLFAKNTAFIIAADEEMIRNGVRAHFSGVDLSDGLETSYFDKLIQVPINVPRLDVAEVKVYLTLLFAEKAVGENLLEESVKSQAESELLSLLSNNWQSGIPGEKIIDCFGEGISDEVIRYINMADELAGIMVSAESIGGNPRLIKRFLNALSIREKIAKLHSITIDDSCLVKMMLLERCASSAAYEFLVKKVSESADGKLELLADIELKISEGDEYKLPDDSWNTDFVKEWIKLQPPLGDYDLRPLLYLCRDKSISLSTYEGLSPHATRIFTALNSTGNTIDRAIVDDIKTLGETEATNLLKYIGRKGRINQWDRKILNSALHVVEAYPSLGVKLADYLRDIPTTSLKPNFIPPLREKDWMKPLLDKWESDTDTPKPVKAAIKNLREM